MTNPKNKVVKRKRGRPEASKPEAREDIKLAALAEFAKHGFRGTSLDRIAKSAGVAKPLIHYHFETKDKLWQQVVAEGYDQFQEDALKLASTIDGETPSDFLPALSRAVIQFIAKRSELIQISIDETRQGGARADWMTENYLVPQYTMVARLIEARINAASGSYKLASHLLPSIFGAIIFPFIDANTVSKAFDTDVFSEDYIGEQADFIARLVMASVGDAPTP